MPFLAGACLGLFGLALIFLPSSEESGVEKEETKGKDAEVRANQKKLLFAFLTLVGYILFFEPLGFFLSTFVFFFLLFKLTDPKRWLMPSVLSISSVFLSYLIFSVWLKCSLPVGILNF